MTNLTLTIDDEVLRRARIRALEEGTSVNALVRQYLESFAGESAKLDGLVSRLMKLSLESTASSGPEGRGWTREDLYERPLRWVGNRDPESEAGEGPSTEKDWDGGDDEGGRPE